jgi:hypothetical protein
MGKSLNLLLTIFLSVGSLFFSSQSLAEFKGHYHLNHEVNPAARERADSIYRKCIHKAKRIADERVCDSERSAIHVCMRAEMKEHNGKASQSTCERLFIM